MRALRTAAWGSVLALVLGACGAQSAQVHHAPQRPRLHTGTSDPRLAEVLSVPEVGRFFGRCAPGSPQWRLRFVNDAGADDLVISGSGKTRRKADVRPGAALTWELTPGKFRSHEPSDPLTNNPAATVLTTAPLSLVIIQGTEPHIYRIDAEIALAAAIGDTVDCAPVSTTLRALTYFNGGQPSTP